MFVLHVHDRYSALGGADWHLLSVLDALPEEVRAAGLFGRDDGSALPALNPGGRAARVERRFIRKLDKKAPFAAEEETAARVSAALDDLQPDLIHVHNILNPRLLETLAQAGPSVITVQDHRFFCPGAGKVRPDGGLCDRTFGLECAGCFRDEEYFLRLLRLVRARLEALQDFDCLIVLSHYMKGELAASGLRPESIAVIPPFPHGLDYSGEPASFGRGALFAGRLVRAKGVFDLLEALARVDSDVEAVIAGRGGADDEVRRAIASAGLTDRVQTPGWMSHAEMAGLYRRSRMVVLPSLWQEPFGITGLEAQYMARPVAAYDVGGVRDWLADGETGIIVPPGNRLALAAAVNVLSRDPDAAAELGRAGRERARRLFDPERLTGRLVGLYREVAGRV